MNGSLDLRLALIGGKTCPTHVVAVPPLQCSRVRYDDHANPGTANLTLLQLGGVLQGDQLTLALTLEAGATAHLTTAAAMQIYRMPEQAAAQTTAITLHPGAHLRYLPEPTILFAESRFSQALTVTLHENATLIWRDLLVCGRLAHGEVHQYTSYRSALTVYASDGRCLLTERGLLEPARFSPAVIGIQAAYPVLGSLYMLQPGANLAVLLAQARQALCQHPAVLAEAGTLPNDCGILVRALGTSASAVRAALDAVMGNRVAG